MGNAVIRSRGYTLVEVLVAMVIFSILMTLAVSSYRYFFTSASSKDYMSGQLSLLAKRKIINNSIKGMQAYYYLGFEGKGELFFIGDKESFSFITNSPGYLKEPMVIANFFISDSGKLLGYCELPLGSTSLANYKFSEENCPSFQTYLEAESISFSYFAWKDVFELDNYYSEILNVAIKPKPLWRLQYRSAETITLPLYLKITTVNADPFLPADMIFELPQERPHSKADKNAL